MSHRTLQVSAYLKTNFHLVWSLSAPPNWLTIFKFEVCPLYYLDIFYIICASSSLSIFSFWIIFSYSSVSSSYDSCFSLAMWIFVYYRFSFMFSINAFLIALSLLLNLSSLLADVTESSLLFFWLLVSLYSAEDSFFSWIGYRTRDGLRTSSKSISSYY